jgi:hypothetical protein
VGKLALDQWLLAAGMGPLSTILIRLAHGAVRRLRGVDCRAPYHPQGRMVLWR